MSLAGKVRNTVIGLMRSMFGAYRVDTVSGAPRVEQVGIFRIAGTAGSPEIQFDPVGDNQLSMAAVWDIVWTNGTTTSDSKDTGIQRVAAGVVGITNGSTGTGFLQTAGFARVSGDGTNTTITPATTGLSVTLAASRHYAFKMVLFVEETTAADGLRVDFDGGAATMTDFRVHGTVADTAGVRSLTQSTALVTDITDTTTTGAAMAVFEGFMTVNAAGTFIPRYAKEADAAGAALNLRRGSYLEVWDVA